MTIKRTIAAVLAAALITISPGIAPYQALAAGASAGRAGLPAGSFAPALQKLATPAALPRVDGLKLHGVDMRAALSRLAGHDLSAPENFKALASVWTRLAAEGPAEITEARLLEALAVETASTREEADRLLSLARAGDASVALADSLDAADRPFLLDAERSRLLKTARTEILVRRGTAGWGKAVEEAEAAVGSESAFTPLLSKPGKREAAQKGRISAKAVAQLREVAKEDLLPKWIRALAPLKRPFVGVSLAVGVFAFASGAVPLWTLAVVAGVAGSILLHETAHLWRLKRLGDDTAAAHGVKSLNPLGLVSAVGTVALPVLTAVVSQLTLGVPIVFGWAKPIPVDFNKLKDPARDAAAVAWAGPLMNLALAGAFAIGASLIMPIGVAAAGAALLLAKINLGLFVFNMIPLPQMDGGKVAIGALAKYFPALYARWTESPNLPRGYQSAFKRLYEGPANILTRLGLAGQGKTNLIAAAITLGLFAVFSGASYFLLGAPVLLLMLVCSWDYYCVAEKIQNEAAVQSLIPIMQGFASELAQLAEKDPLVKSEIDVEAVEYSLNGAFESVIDEVIDSEGFDGLSDAQKMERFRTAYRKAAIGALKARGMSADDEETIARLIDTPEGGRFMDRLQAWIEQNKVWEKWHSPGRKAKDGSSSKKKDKLKAMGQGGATTLGVMALLAAGGALLLGADPQSAGALASMGGLGLVAGTVANTPAPAPMPTFEESVMDQKLGFSEKEQQALLAFLEEMKLKPTQPVIGRSKETSAVVGEVAGPRGVSNSVVIHGVAGSGKTAIVEKIAQAMLALSDPNTPEALRLSSLEGRYLLNVNMKDLLQQDNPAKTLGALLGLLKKYNESDRRAGNKIVIFIDEAHDLFKHEKGSQIANLLKVPTRDGDVAIILATTSKEYQQYIENDEALKRRFRPVAVEPTSAGETLRYLQGARGYYEQLFGSKIEAEALADAANLAEYDQEIARPASSFEFLKSALKKAGFKARRDALALAIQDRIGDLEYALGRLAEELGKTDGVKDALKDEDPDAIDLYNQAAELSRELVSLYRERDAVPREGTPLIGAAEIKKEISDKTGIASGRLSAGREDMSKYLTMEEALGKKVIGQDEAIHAIAEAVRAEKAGLKDDETPTGTFYFTGPTGTGKTLLAKKLAEFMFGSEENLIRLDMTEYMHSHEVAKMIGSPPGYIGYEQDGQLTEKVRRKPYSVVLFDEIEKAHPAAFLILLQVLADGRMTSGQGRTVSFKNTIVIMTSNLGMSALMLGDYVAEYKSLHAGLMTAARNGRTAELKEYEQKIVALAVRMSEETKKQALEVTAEAFKTSFPPEFAGRLSAPPIVFNRITPETAPQIVRLELGYLKKTMARGGNELQWTPEAVELIAREGFDIELGARPLKNALRRMVTQPVAKEILKAAVANGNKPRANAIRIDASRGKLEITVEALPPRKVEKTTPEEGAAELVFENALKTALDAAALKTQVAADPVAVDAWVREAIRAFAPQTQASAASAESPTAVAASAATTTVIVAAQAPLALSPYNPGTPLEMAAPSAFTAAHNSAEQKDPGIESAKAALKAALDQAGWPENAQALLLRKAEDPADPFQGWLQVFVKQAKAFAPAGAVPAAVSFEAGAESVRVAVRRAGAIDERETLILRRHFTGPVPRDGAETVRRANLIEQSIGHGRRSLLNLYRVLSRAGGRFGWSSDASGTNYWVEILKPVEPPPAVQPVSSPTEESPAQGTVSNGSDQAGSAAPAPLSFQAAATPAWSGYTRVAFDISKSGLSDPGLKAAGTGFLKEMTEAGYSRDARVAVAGFLKEAAAWIKRASIPDMLDDEETPAVLADWLVDESGARLMLRREGAPWNGAEQAEIDALFESDPLLKAKLEAVGMRLYRTEGNEGDGALWLELPAPSRAPPGQILTGQADGSTGAAGTSAAAADLSKVSADSTDSPNAVWAAFRPGMDMDQIRRFLANYGLTVDHAMLLGSRPRVRVLLADPAAAKAAALLLSNKPQVAALDVHPAILALLAGGPAPAAAPDDSPRAKLSVDAGLAANIVSITIKIGAMGPDYTLMNWVRPHFQRRGLTITSHRVAADGLVVVAEAASAAWAGQKALEIAGEPNAVKSARVSPEAMTLLEASLAAQAARRAAPPAAAAGPVPQEGPAFTELLRRKTRDFALAVLAQGDERSNAARLAAAETLAAAATPADLTNMRGDWIRLENMTDNWPKVVAAALILARHGAAEDLPRLLRALDNMEFGGYGTHTYNPAKRRLQEAYAELLVRTGAQPADLVRMFHNEDAKSGTSRVHDPENYRRYKNALILEALYLAVSRTGGPEHETFLQSEWKQDRAEALYAYLKRVNPAALRALYDQWRLDHRKPDGWMRLALPWAIAEHGDAADLAKLFEMARTGWNGDSASERSYEVVTDAFAKLLVKLNAWPSFARDLRLWLREPMGDSGNFNRMITAVQAAGAAGTEEDLALLEAVLAVPPSVRQYMHEMSQHEAATAWAKLVLREGLLPQFLTQPERRVGGQDLPRLLAMLADVNPMVNKAALEALRLYLAPSRPPRAPRARPRAAPAPPTGLGLGVRPPEHPLFRAAPVPSGGGESAYYLSDSEILADATSGLSRLAESRREKAQEWVNSMLIALNSLVPGLSFNRYIKTFTTPGGATVVTYVLRQSVTQATTPAMADKVKELVLYLLYLRGRSEDERNEKLARLEENFPGTRPLYELIESLANISGVSIGVDRDPARRTAPTRGELEVWLSFDVPVEPDPPQNNYSNYGM